MPTDVDFSLMHEQVGPIAGPGSEVVGQGWSWCGYCGYTGRCLGPKQASCPERNGWHKWLDKCADTENLGIMIRLAREQREAERANHTREPMCSSEP